MRSPLAPDPARRPALSVVIPMYNEIDNVEPMLARVHEGLPGYGGAWELICVDDGSRDDTGERLMETAGATAAMCGPSGYAATSARPPPCRRVSTPRAAN